jgi:hypothetical protein
VAIRVKDPPKELKSPEKVANKVLKSMRSNTDAGAMWLMGLDPIRKHQLVDFAGQLSQLIPMPMSHITEKDFISHLARAGHYQSAVKMFKRLVGDLQGWLGPYEIWWSHRYCHYYTMYLRRGNNEEDSKSLVAKKLKIELNILLSRVSRRDINTIINMLLLKAAEESEGHIAMSVAIRASEGSVKDTELFYRYVKRKEADLGGDKELDPTVMTEEELLAHIKKMKKQMGVVKPLISLEEDE